MPASITGCSTPSTSVSRVRMEAERRLTAMAADPPVVGGILGSDSDLPVMQGAIEALAEFDVPCEVRIISAHRTPAAMDEYARSAAGRGLPGVLPGARG